MIYHVDQFVDIGPCLNSWDRVHLIMVHDPFNILLDLAWYYFIEDFSSMFISDVDLYFFLVIYLFGFVIRDHNTYGRP